MGLGIAIAVNDQVEAELAEAVQVEVYERLGYAATYRIRYDMDISEGDIPLLTDSRLQSGSMLSILVPVENTPECLVKGPVHNQRIHLAHGGASSWLEVVGSDTTVMMDRETRTTQWEDLRDSDVITTILGNYGYVPDVESTDAGHYSDKHSLVQRDSDYRFVQRLARRNGCLFWVTSNEVGIETAHFKQPSLDSPTEVELLINVENSNIDHFDIAWDVERPTSVTSKQLDLNSLDDIDGENSDYPLTPLGNDGLTDIVSDTQSVHLNAPVDDTGDLRARTDALLLEAGWFIKAQCETNLDAAGGLIRAHTLVDVRGAGQRFSGSYFAAGVRHIIDPAMHRMEISLLRNAWS
jgi:phage protein D